MDRFDFISVIGSGAYGEVLKCRNRETGQIVAIKRIRKTDGERRVRQVIAAEIRILRSVAHRNIVKLLDVMESRHHISLVLEYVPSDLLSYLERHDKGLPPDQVELYMFQICEAVAYCHSKNILHRDIKLENLLLDTTGLNPVVKLCDFGFARKLNAAADVLTSYVATRWYRAPELLLGSRHYSAAIDVFAIGCILVELATGEPLFPGRNDIHQLYLLRKYLGPFTDSQRLQLDQNPDLIAFIDRDSEIKPVTLTEYLNGKLSPLATSFINAVVLMDPDQRLTSRQCLQHPYFDEIRTRRSYQNLLAQPLAMIRPPEMYTGPNHNPLPKFAYQAKKPIFKHAKQKSSTILPAVKRQRTIPLKDVRVISHRCT